MKKIAYYVRVSTRDKQDYKYQIDALDKHVAKSDFKPNNTNRIIYQEKESGYKDDRQELERLLSDIKENPTLYDCVYVTEISRLGRNSRSVRKALEVFIDCRTNLYIKHLNINLLNSDGDIDFIGNIILSIFIELSDAEARGFKERSKDGIRSSVIKGNAGGGRFLPYGYTKIDKKLVIDEEEAKVVRLIFDLYLSGLGFKAIAGILNNKGIPTKSRKMLGTQEVNSKNGKLANDVRWSDKTVDDILSNTTHIGHRRYWGGSRKKGNENEPEIFSTIGPTLLEDHSIFHKCAEIRKSKTHKNSLTVYEYLLKDRMNCGKCGRNYFAKYKPVPNGDKVYICSSRLKQAGNCGNVGLNISLIESIIFHEIVQTDSILKYIGNQDKLKKQFEKDLWQLTNSKETSVRRKAQVEREIQATLDLQIQALASNSMKLVTRYSTKLDELNTEEDNLNMSIARTINQIEKVQNALTQRTSITTTTKELLNSVKDRTRLRAIFLDLINKVIITPIDKDTILADVFVQLNGVVLSSTLKIFVDLSGMRLKKKQYRYRAASELGFELKYENNKLLTDIERIQNTLFTIKDNDGLIPNFDLQYVPESRILEIPISQKMKK